MPLTAGPGCLPSKLTGMPSAMKLDVTLRSIKWAAARYSRRSVRIREINRMDIAKAPVDPNYGKHRPPCGLLSCPIPARQ